MKVSMAEKIGYSMGDGSANLVFQMMMMFQLFFYTDVFGIKATAAGMILLVAPPPLTPARSRQGGGAYNASEIPVQKFSLIFVFR